MRCLPLLLCSLLVISCGLPDIRLKRKVFKQEIVGTWNLDPKSSALAKDNDGHDYTMAPGIPHTIVFNADGTCLFHSVLQMPTRHVEATGEWSISPTRDDPKGSKVDLQLQIDGEGTYSFSLDVRQEFGNLVLWEFWGDPDLWNFLDYKRQIPDPSQPNP